MKFSHFFIERPIFATVMSVIITIVGALSFFILPIEQYPQIAPPTIQVTASYPGANAKTIAETVATPIEQEMSGIEGMIYMSSQSTADGTMTLTLTFELGTDLDNAQVLVQNRVAIAEPRLPEQVRRLGVVTKKNSPDLMMVVNMYSPDGTYDQNYISNYATLQVMDQIRRISGVGDIFVFGGGPYAMRIWLNPDLVQSYGLSVAEVIAALRAQNIQVASGTLNQSPQPQGQNPYELQVQTQGRLIEPEQFGQIIVKAGDDGRIVNLEDISRIELGVQTYSSRGYLGKNPAVALPIFQRPGSNALETAQQVRDTVSDLSKRFPPGLKYDIVYDPTEFVSKSIDAVLHTIIEAVFLVVLVIIVFLQSWRAAIIPVVAIPVSLVGTFAVMHLMDFSLNNLTLFGLVLVIGIVVDDAIVVVENIDRNLHRGMKPHDAARKSMNEIGSALIATSLVLIAVFVPTSMLGGISGQFYKQFGVTVAVATAISTFVSLTLSPAMAALLMRKNEFDPKRGKSFLKDPVRYFFCRFNQGMDWLTERYSWLTTRLVRKIAIVLVVYAGLMGLAAFQFKNVPAGFIPAQDQGYFIVSIQLPPGGALDRTDEIVREAVNRLLEIDGVTNAVAFSGFSGATFTNASNAAAIFPVLEDFDERHEKGLSYEHILGQMRMAMSGFKDAFVVVIPPPPVRGIGTGGGFKMMIQDRTGQGLGALEQATWQMAGAANQSPATTSVYTFFDNSTPQVYLDIDREKAERLGVAVDTIFDALEVYFGSVFVNDFNYLGRTFQVIAQADAQYRLNDDDLMRVRVQNNRGESVPLGSIATIKDSTGPSRLPRYNLFNSIDLNGDTAAGFSTGEAIQTMEQLAEKILPPGIGYEWTELAYQQKQTGNTPQIAFTLAVIFVLLVLAAQYESWVLPMAVVLIVPMCLLSAITGIAIAGQDNNILSQIGFVILIGLACKNAILIVEFAHELEVDEGMSRWDAAIEAAKMRLRPILMTSFAFILGVVPLVLATGAGAEMRQVLGVTVFSGMIGVTFFGLIFTPVFYVLCRKLSVIKTPEEEKKA